MEDKMKKPFQSKKIVYGLVFALLLNTPITAYANGGDQGSFYDKVKTFILGDEEAIDEDAALSEFRRQFNAGNNNMSQVLGSTTDKISSYSYSNSEEALSTLVEPQEEQPMCVTLELEDQIPFGPFDTSVVTEIVHQEYGFAEGQTSETQLLVDVKLTSDASASFSVLGGTLVGQGEHCNIWVVNPDEYYSEAATKYTMTTDQLQTDGNAIGTDAVTAKLAKNIDVICEKVSTIGDHAGVLFKTNNSWMPEIGDIDMDGRINVILYAIGSGAGGYFYALDYFPSYTGRAIDAIHITTSSGMDSSGSGEFGAYAYGSVAHEMQHLMFYTYYAHLYESELWINEGLSQISETYQQDYTNSSTINIQNADTIIWRLKTALANSYTTGSTYSDFFNWGGTIKNYGMAFMFNALLEEREGAYIHKVYDYFKSYAVESSDPDYTYDSTLTRLNYPESLFENWGEVLRVVLGDSVDTTELTSDEILEYVYTMFMESYMSGGGKVIDNDKITLTDRIWAQSYGSLWSLRNGNTYYGSNSSSTSGNGAYGKINSGGDITLEGYPSDSGDIGASHEMAYTLDTSDYNVAETNVLEINIPKTEGLRAYVALYDVKNANPIYGTTTINSSYDPTLDTADLYPIELGVDNYVTVDSASIVPHLFVFTYYNDVNTTVTYDWIDTRMDIETIAKLELLETSYDFDNTEKTPTVIVRHIETDELLIEEQDYTVTYSNNTNAGSAIVTIDGIGDYKGSTGTTFDILPISIVNATIIGINDRYNYTGSAITPSFSVTMKENTLEENTDYIFTFTDNLAITKKGHLTIQGVGNYSEYVGAYFEIYN